MEFANFLFFKNLYKLADQCHTKTVKQNFQGFCGQTCADRGIFRRILRFFLSAPAENGESS